MKGIIQKDIYMLTTHLKFQLFTIIIYCVCFSFIGSGTLGMLGIFLAALLSNSLFLIDEKNKWNKFALTLPYSRKDIVLSRYILAALLSLGAAVLYALSGTAVMAIIKSAYPEAMPIGSFVGFAVIAFSMSILAISILLPATIKFGFEKSRYILILIGAVCGIIYGLGHAYINEAINNCSYEMQERALSNVTLYVGALIISLICFAVSAAISIKIFSNKEVG